MLVSFSVAVDMSPIEVVADLSKIGRNVDTSGRFFVGGLNAETGRWTLSPCDDFDLPVLDAATLRVSFLVCSSRVYTEFALFTSSPLNSADYNMASTLGSILGAVTVKPNLNDTNSTAGSVSSAAPLLGSRLLSTLNDITDNIIAERTPGTQPVVIATSDLTLVAQRQNATGVLGSAVAVPGINGSAVTLPGSFGNGSDPLSNVTGPVDLALTLLSSNPFSANASSGNNSRTIGGAVLEFSLKSDGVALNVSNLTNPIALRIPVLIPQSNLGTCEFIILFEREGGERSEVNC